MKIGDTIALKAVSRNSASGLNQKKWIDLEKVPYINWSWRIDNRLARDYDETMRSGDQEIRRSLCSKDLCIYPRWNCHVEHTGCELCIGEASPKRGGMVQCICRKATCNEGCSNI